MTNLDDANQLVKSFGIMASGLLEVGEMAKKLDAKKLTDMGYSRGILGLASLVMIYLGKPLRKDMTLTDWACPNLTPEQTFCITSHISNDNSRCGE